MSPVVWRSTVFRVRFPRVSGDEPAKAEALLVREQFSPRERG